MDLHPPAKRAPINRMRPVFPRPQHGSTQRAQHRDAQNRDQRSLRVPRDKIVLGPVGVLLHRREGAAFCVLQQNGLTWHHPFKLKRSAGGHAHLAGDAAHLLDEELAWRLRHGEVERGL